MSGQILVNDDEAAIVQALKVLLGREGYEITTTQTAEKALATLQEQCFNLLITDVTMAPMSGMDLLAEARKLHPRMPVILITGYDTMENAVDAMRLGAFDLISKPFRIKNLMVTIQRALTYESAFAHSSPADQSLQVHVHAGGLVGESPGMLTLYRMIQHLAPTNDTLFIWGEDGTEREEVAQAVHHASARHDGPFLAVNCNTMEDSQLEQALLGRQGLFQQGLKGTVFLDDILSLSPHLQQVLPHYLRKLAPSSHGKGLDIRLVVADADPLDDAVVEGRFDRELNRELKALMISVPPLRDRLEDLPLLCRFILNGLKSQVGRCLSLSPSALRAFEQYAWPENVEELNHVLQRSAKRCKGDIINPIDLPEPVQPSGVVDTPSTGNEWGMEEFRWRALSELIRGREAEYIPLLVSKTNGDTQQAAKILAIPEEELTILLEEFGVQ